MKCKFNEEDLILYYYDELESSVKKQIQSHLEKCGKCVLTLEKLRATLNRIELTEPGLSEVKWDNYRKRIYEKIEGESLRKKPFFFTPRFAQTVAVAALLLVTVFGGLKFYEKRQSDKFIMENYELMMDLELIEDLEILRYLEEIEEV